MQNLQPFIDSLQKFAQKRLGFKYPPKLFLKQDQENAKSVFGKTAYYDPNEKSITIFTTGRHPKDILRSIAHELVHHCQNLRGDLSPEKCGEMGTDYAQKNDHMREMEREAYEKGNLCFRDWEDGIKVAMQQENNQLKENKKMVKISRKELKGLIGKILEARLEEMPKDAQDTLDAAKKAAGEVMKTAKAAETAKKAKSFMKTAKQAAGDVMKTAKTPVREETEELEEENKIKCPNCGHMNSPDAKKCANCGYNLENLQESEQLEEKGCYTRDEEDTMEEAAKPDYIDLDGDGDKKESMKKAAADKKKQQESKIQTPEQEQKLYESRFNKRNNEIFDKLKKLWTK
jgi:ribosomal protein L40E